MDTPTPVASLREALGLKLEDLAEKLGCSKGHAHDLCTGRRSITPRIAVQLEALSGRPWREWVTEPSAPPDTAPQQGAVV